MTQLNNRLKDFFLGLLFALILSAPTSGHGKSTNGTSNFLALPRVEGNQNLPPEAQNLIESYQRAFAEVKRWLMIGFGTLLGMGVLIFIILLYNPREIPSSRPFDPKKDRVKPISRPNESSGSKGPINKGWNE